MFKQAEEQYLGRKMKYVGCSDIQVNYAGNSDPRDFMVEGKTYTVFDARVGGWSTTLEFVEFPKKTFNSVCFEVV